MFFLPLILAAGSFSTLISGAPVLSFLSNGVSRRASPSLKERGGYSVYGGTGDISNGWPASSSWLSFDTLFTANTDNIQNSCAQWNVPNPSSAEISDIKSAITSVASSTGVDSRFILAIMIQESNGCVRAPTTNYGVSNPGLMQSHAGTGTCHDPSVQNPCPSSEITQMIQDGAGGTSAGDGLKQCIASSGATDDSKYFKAARIYNSGSIASGGNLGAGIATHCYASDLANRLTGWTGTSSGCSEGTIGSITSSSGGAASGGSSSSAAASAVSTSPVASSAYSAPSSTSASAAKPSSSGGGGIFQQKPSTISSSTPTHTASSGPATTATTTATTTAATVSATATATATSSTPASASPSSSSSSGTPVSTTAQKYPYAVSSCTSWYTVVANDYCALVEQKFGITAAELQGWNAQLEDDCSNLWLGYQYCVGA